MATNSILIIEDDKDISELIKYNLKKEGYQAAAIFDGDKALEEIKSHPYDLILLDLMLPGLDGLELCKIIKGNRETAEIPIIMVSAKGEETDIVLGLELGAEDYIVKPFSPKVLIARVRAVLRRKLGAKIDKSRTVEIDKLKIHPGKRDVIINGKPVDLTFTEFEILHFLARKPGWVFTRDQIVNAVKGDDYPVTDRSIDVQIAGLRKKLGVYGKYIETIRGVGYRFIDIELGQED